jgi:hypothetical protein
LAHGGAKAAMARSGRRGVVQRDALHGGRGHAALASGPVHLRLSRLGRGDVLPLPGEDLPARAWRVSRLEPLCVWRIPVVGLRRGRHQPGVALARRLSVGAAAGRHSHRSRRHGSARCAGRLRLVQLLHAQP